MIKKILNTDYKTLIYNTTEILPPDFKDYRLVKKSEKLQKLNYFMMKLKEIVWLNEKYPGTFETIMNSYYDNYTYLSLEAVNTTLFNKVNFNGLERKVLLKFLLLYYIFSFENKFFSQRMILQIIRIMKVMETSKNFNRIKPPLKVLKLTYVNSLYLNILRTIQKRKFVQFVQSQPIMYLFKTFLLHKGTNEEALKYFFSNVYSLDFVCLNYNVFFEFRNELLQFYNLELTSVLKTDSVKLQTYLFNYYINDFLLFMQKEEMKIYATTDFFLNPKFSYYKYFDMDEK